MVCESKLKRLQEVLSRAAPFLVAVSGGVDSRFLLQTALRLGAVCEAAVFTGPHQSPRERNRSLEWLHGCGVKHVHQVQFHPLEEDDGHDPGQRCYKCKMRMFGLARAKAMERGLMHVLDGTQADDLSTHRPGLKALKEQGVLSPLAEVGLGKQEIRDLARRFGLERPEQPSRPCLLTRFPYEHHPSQEELEGIGRVEDRLSALGLQCFRFRCLQGGSYTLHVSAGEGELYAEIRPAVESCLVEEGFGGAQTLFLQNVSGYFDQRRRGHHL
jgi:pyridinium-3,5-biscarboxylic acid mononucleotide sulfurtransferase